MNVIFSANSVKSEVERKTITFKGICVRNLR